MHCSGSYLAEVSIARDLQDSTSSIFIDKSNLGRSLAYPSKEVPREFRNKDQDCKNFAGLNQVSVHNLKAFKWQISAF